MAWSFGRATLLVSPERLGQRLRAYRNAIKTAKLYGAFVNNRAGAFSMTHLADTDRQAGEEAERSFLFVRQCDAAGQCPDPGGQEVWNRSQGDRRAGRYSTAEAIRGA